MLFNGARALEFASPHNFLLPCNLLTHLTTLLGPQRQLSLPPEVYQDFDFPSVSSLLSPENTCQRFRFKN